MRQQSTVQSTVQLSFSLVYELHSCCYEQVTSCQRKKGSQFDAHGEVTASFYVKLRDTQKTNAHTQNQTHWHILMHTDTHRYTPELKSSH